MLNPLVILLAVLASVSFATGDFRAGIVMSLMIAAGRRAEADPGSQGRQRGGQAQGHDLGHGDGDPRRQARRKSPSRNSSPATWCELAAGDMIPADVRIVVAKDLFVTQRSLTGESFPVEKFEVERNAATTAPTRTDQHRVPRHERRERLGDGGRRRHRERDTYLGGMAESLSEQPTQTAFDKGIAQFTWLMLRFMLVMVPLVFVINGLTKGNWGEAFFFAVAVAVGLTPEMLPMIVTVCLSKGAIAMSRKKVIVKRINAIQNLGAMDVLCTDKTGTLTMDQVILERHCDVVLNEDDGVLALAYINSHFQTGLKNVLDRAVLAHTETHAHARSPNIAKVDEIPFDFQRRIMSVVVRTPEGKDRIISKGAPEAIFPRCTNFELDGELLPDGPRSHRGSQGGVRAAQRRRLPRAGHRQQGHRAARHRRRATPLPTRKADECDLILERLRRLPRSAEGDRHGGHQGACRATAWRSRSSPATTTWSPARSARRSGCPTEFVLLGSDVEKMTDEELADAAEETDALRPRLARAQAADHQGAAIPQAHRRLHGRRHQRRPGACTPPTSESASIRPSTSPRSRPT